MERKRGDGAERQKWGGIWSSIIFTWSSGRLSDLEPRLRESLKVAPFMDRLVQTVMCGAHQ